MSISLEQLSAQMRRGEQVPLRHTMQVVLTLSIPSILQQIVVTAVEYIDAAMVGHIGASATASIGIVSSSTWLMHGMLAGLYMSFAIQVAQYLGADRQDDARGVLRQSMIFNLVVGLAAAAFGIGISRFLPGWLGADPSLQADASAYFAIWSASLPFLMIMGTYSSMLRSSGDALTPGLISVLTCVLDVIFNFCLINPTREMVVCMVLRNLQGIYDPAFLSQLGMPLYAPSNYQELNYWLQQLLSDRFHGPRAIRYPRGGQDAALAEFGCTGEDYDFLRKVDDATIVLVSYADELADLLQAERELQQKSIACDVIKAVKLYPFTDKMIADLSKYKIILFAEECIANGSIGEHLEYALQQNGWNGRFIHCAVRNACLPHASVAQIKQATGLDAAHLVQAVQMAVTKGENLL